MEVYHDYRLYLDEYDGFLFGSISDIIKGGWSFSKPHSLLTTHLHSSFRPVAFPPFPSLALGSGLKDIYDAQGLPSLRPNPRNPHRNCTILREAPPTRRSHGWQNSDIPIRTRRASLGVQRCVEFLEFRARMGI